jgi:uncharacterized membrane protein
MSLDWERRLANWTVAGVVDLEAAERIRRYEQTRARTTRTRWSVWLALIFGVGLLGAGLLLLVSAGWDDLSPASRLALVAALVASFHVAAGLVASRSKPVATALHVVGTAALGPGIFMAGAILNLDEHWPSAVLLWALGAFIAWLVRRDTADAAALALLVPAWLLCEWAAVGETSDLRFSVVGQAGAFLVAIAYLTTPLTGSSPAGRRVLSWIGALAFLPAAITVGVQAANRLSPPAWLTRLPALPPVSWPSNTLAWALTLVLPMGVAVLLRGRGAWLNAVAAAWVVVLATLPVGGSRLVLYGWLATGAVALGAWGIREMSSDRINLATASFALVVVFFYFDSVIDKMGRSASLIGLGVLFLAGGYGLERVRRRMVERAGGGVR